MSIFNYFLLIFVLFLTLCQSSPIDVPMSSNPSTKSPSSVATPSIHAADTDVDYYEDPNFVFSDTDHYENLGCDAYGYVYEDY